MPEHEWIVEFRNDSRGFTKQYGVEAKGYQEAVTRATAGLVEQGYSRTDFEVNKIQRGRIVGT